MSVILCNCPPPVPSGTTDGQVPVWDEATQSWVPGTTPTPDCCPPDGTETGDTLVWDGSEWVAQQPLGGIDSGTSFPSSPSAGDIFYRTDLREIGYYDGTRWVGDIITIPMVNFNKFAQQITGTSTPYAAPILADILLVRLDVAFYLEAPANASNYWTYKLNTLPGTIVEEDRKSVYTDWSGVSHVLSYVLNSSNKVIYVKVEKTGSPGPFTLVPVLFARRILT